MFFGVLVRVVLMIWVGFLSFSIGDFVVFFYDYVIGGLVRVYLVRIN